MDYMAPYIAQDSQQAHKAALLNPVSHSSAETLASVALVTRHLMSPHSSSSNSWRQGSPGSLPVTAGTFVIFRVRTSAGVRHEVVSRLHCHSSLTQLLSAVLRKQTRPSILLLDSCLTIHGSTLPPAGCTIQHFTSCKFAC